MSVTPLRIGLFGIGLDAYWPQFPVDHPERAFAAGREFGVRRARVPVLLFLGALLPFLPLTATAQQAPPRNETVALPDPQLEEHFRTPPPGARPWVFWMWLGVDTTPETITKDLEEIHAKGIEGVILYDVIDTTLRFGNAKMVLADKAFKSVPTKDYPGAHSTKIPLAPMPTWSPHSREMYRFAAREAARLGVKFCVSVGLGGTSGPIAPEYGQQKLVWSETAVRGPQRYEASLPLPDRSVAASGSAASHPAGHEGSDLMLRPVAVLAVPDKDGFTAGEVVDLSAKTDAGGQLRWDVPTGSWTILRFAYEPTGARNSWGLCTDHMSAEALDKTWEATLGRVLAEMTPDERRGLYGVEDDSWEVGETTWTGKFPAEFRRLRGYDLIPWLPVLAGRKMGAPDDAAGVRRDFRRTIADLIATEHYAHLRELANREGLVCYSEPAGPNSAQLDYQYNCKGVDFAMAEFWAPSPHRPTPERRFLLRNAASANHVYGRRVTACESFTSVGPFWEETFFGLKNTADQAFCDGCNLNVIHNFSHSPSLTAWPGYTYFAGTLYGRTVTWWDQTPAFNAYLGRCSTLLQEGLPVADALYYRGDDIGYGEPMKTRPALPAEGYDHDNCDLDGLLTRVGIKDGRIVLPDGMSYRMLVLPDNAPMAPAALAKIGELARAGATIIGPRPRGMAGRAISADDKKAFDALVTQLWGGGRIADTAPAPVLASQHVPPDVRWEGLSEHGELDWIHRRAGGTDIYFLASRWDPLEKITCTFRVADRQPELWDPVTGEIRGAPAFRQEIDGTVIPLEFGPRGSVFVVFRRPVAPGSAGTAASNYPGIVPEEKISGSWDVSFDPEWGGPAKAVFDSLEDWTKRPEEGIRHYSGTAVYRKTIQIAALPAAGTRLWLDLGEVHEVASVRLNGVDLGVAWTKPARVDLTRAARAGVNELEITVVNLWPNRLAADESLPPAQRLTETNQHKFSPETPPYPSGLLGPVVLEKATP